MIQRFAFGAAFVVLLAPSAILAATGGVHPLTGPLGAVTCAAYAPDGKTLASGGADRVVRLYDPTTGATLRQLSGAAGTVHAVAWSSDGQRVVAVAEASPLLAWTLDGHVAWTQKIAGHVSALAIAAAPDGKSFAVGYSDGTIRFHDSVTGKAGRILPTGKAPVVAVAWSPDGQYVGSGGKATIQVWSTKTGKLLLTTPVGVKESVSSVAFDRQSKLLAAAGADGLVRLWTIVDGKPARALKAHDLPVKSIVFSNENDLLTSSADSLIRKWNGVTGQQAFQLATPGKAVNAAVYSPDGRQIAAANEDGTLVIWEANLRNELFRLHGPPSPITGVAYLASANEIGAVNSEGWVSAYDATSGVQRWTVLGHGGPATVIVSAGDGRYALTAGGYENPVPADSDGSKPPAADGRRGRIMMWQADGQVAGTLGVHPAPVSALATSPDGRQFVSGSEGDTNVYLWETEAKTQRLAFPTQSGTVRAVALGPGGDPIITGGTDGSVRVSGASGGLKRAFQLGGPVDAVAISPDGEILATAGGTVGADGDHPIKLWDVATGNLRKTLSGHRGRVTGLMFSKDGWYLASSNRAVIAGASIKAPSEARLWTVQNGGLVQTVTATADAMKDITSLTFAPDIHAIALGCTDHQIWMWNAK